MLHLTGWQRKCFVAECAAGFLMRYQACLLLIVFCLSLLVVLRPAVVVDGSRVLGVKRCVLCVVLLAHSQPRRARIADVATHYEQLGGFSPFNDLTFQQVQGVSNLLKQRGFQQPVYVGMRHWTPYVHDVLKDMVQQNVRRILAVIMAPHQCYASWQWYQQTVSAGLAALNVPDVSVTYLQPWATQAGYIEAIADYVRQAYATP